MSLITLKFIGDIFPADELMTSGFGIKSKTTSAIAQTWIRDIKQSIGTADMIMGNLESPLLNNDSQQHPLFHGRALFARMLKEAGINVLNIANNHILEHGNEGVRQTIETLERNNILRVGMMHEHKAKITTLTIKGIKIGIAGFCDERICHLPNPGVYPPLVEQLLVDTLHRMSEQKVHIKILSLHWGNEYINMPSMEQRKLAYHLINQGADLIIGHHPHVIQPYEQYKNGHILYSLGNFCFDSPHSENFSIGMAAEIEASLGGILSVNCKGIQIGNMTKTKHLVSPISSHQFLPFLEKIQHDYSRNLSLSPTDYGIIYQRAYKQIHRRERIRMKTNLIKEFLGCNPEYRQQYAHNLLDYLRYITKQIMTKSQHD